jgi:hypothetical protein
LEELIQTEGKLGEEGLWAKEIKILPCSWIEGVCGHKWVPTLALAGCRGCGSPILMVKQENCPYCNEPAKTVVVRSDHVPKGGGVVERCKGQAPGGETLDIVMERTQWKEIEANGDKKFKEG